MIKAVLFDLDGTLLPMDLNLFFKEYFKLLAAKLYPYGYTDPKKLIRVIWSGVEEVVKNDGGMTNEQVFQKWFIDHLPEAELSHFDILEEFYNNEFSVLKDICGYNADADKAVKCFKNLGLPVVLATKPIFPAVAVEKRMEWAGLDVGDFEYITHYGNSSFCKPDPAYYTDIARTIGVLPEECLMVGNDVSEDMPAEKAGMKVFLLTDCLINTENEDISRYPNGGFKELTEFVKAQI